MRAGVMIDEKYNGADWMDPLDDPAGGYLLDLVQFLLENVLHSRNIKMIEGEVGTSGS